MPGAVNVSESTPAQYFDEFELFSERYLLFEENFGLSWLKIRSRRRDVFINWSQNICLQIMKQSVNFVDSSLVFLLHLLCIALFSFGSVGSLPFYLAWFDTDEIGIIVWTVVGTGKIFLAPATFQLSGYLPFLVVLDLQLADHVIEIECIIFDRRWHSELEGRSVWLLLF